MAVILLQQPKESYDRLTCTITRWRCVYFWKKCEDFDILDHISVNEESNPDKISAFLTDQIDKGYPVGKPLWDVVFLPNCVHAEYGTSSAVALRMHHSVGDGLSFVALVRDMCDENHAADEEIKKLLKGFRKKYSQNFWKKLSCVFQLIFINPSEGMYNWIKALKSQVIPRDLSQNTTCGCIFATTLIDLACLKRISKIVGANVSSVIHAGVAGAVRRTMIDRGSEPTGDITATYILPKLDHPGTLSNNA